MSHTHYSETTLPQVSDAVAEAGASPLLHCTILFHPNLDLIGAAAVLDAGESDWMLGRYAPLFVQPGEQQGVSLEDPYVSRRALHIAAQDGGVSLRRPQQASRCRLADQEVDEVFLDDASLAAGIPLLLSHTVVLILRRCTPAAGVADASHGLVGCGPAMQALRVEIERAAASEQDVLIRGETGSGKELVARAICGASGRAGQALLSVNMAAIPSALATALLFGNTRGAFSGADRARRGYFREADGGTLFLDEVGDTDPEVQPLLLRAIQQGEVQVVGGAVEKVDVRVISATDAEIDEASCDFKSALRYRLGALEIRVPCLRERPEDIGALLLHFLRRACEREGRMELLPTPDTAPLQLARWASLFFAFARYDWPGNVRQLENFANQVVIASDAAPVIPATVLDALAADTEDVPQAAAGQRTMRQISDSEFAAAMTRHRWEISRVATALGVSRQSVYRRIDQSAVYCRANDVPEDRLQAAMARCGGDVVAASAELQVSAAALRSRLRASGFPAGL